MKKTWCKLLIVIVCLFIFVLGIFLIQNIINVRKVYKMPIATLLSSYKEDPKAFKAKYEKHIVYVTGRVYYVFKKGDDANANKPGTKVGSHVQLVDPEITPNNDSKEIYAKSILCVFYNKNLYMFEKLDFLDPLKRTIITIKGTLYVENGEIILIDSTKVGSEQNLTNN
jgi:hypothetical protein